MMRKLLKFTVSALLMMSVSSVFAQTRLGGIVEMESLEHDFGEVTVKDGPLSCSFTVKNISSKDINIFNVVSSCGCTDVSWTREVIKPGQKGTIKATYKNDDGPYPFDKTLTAYISDLDKPVLLKLRGVVHDVVKPLDQTYTLRYGALGLRASSTKVGNLSQGEQKSGQMKVANLSDKAIEVSFTDLSAGLSLKLDNQKIPAKGTATLSYTVTASPERWGKNFYYATVLVNGKKVSATGSEVSDVAPGAEAIIADTATGVGKGTSRIAFWAFTKDNSSKATKEDRKNAGTPSFKSTNYSYGNVKAGTKVKASFELTNAGKNDLKIHKVDTGTSRARVTRTVASVKSKAKEKIEIEFDTTGLPKGEATVIVTLLTDSPVRPFVDLYITGFIK